MRIVVLGSSIYSETACAVAVRLSELGHIPAGVLSLSTFDRDTLLRKLGQWGFQRAAQYARAKLLARKRHKQYQLQNPYLGPWLKHATGVFLSLRDASNVYGFPISLVANQNSPDAISRLKAWSPELIVFAGGNILRKQILTLPRLGVLNIHLGLLPQIRGMSGPEWSLLKDVPLGITIHYMDSGIDTGPILQRYEHPDVACCESLADLRHRLIAFGVDKLGQVIAGLDRGTIVSTPQPTPSSIRDGDNQYFAMHEWLQKHAATILARHNPSVPAETIYG
ncbi:MAG: formyltransferase family protein [Candidatus Sulfotelmatobacter sp.]